MSAEIKEPEINLAPQQPTGQTLLNSYLEVSERYAIISENLREVEDQADKLKSDLHIVRQQWQALRQRVNVENERLAAEQASKRQTAPALPSSRK